MTASTIGVSPGSGRNVATDLISGTDHQYSKMEFGVDNTATPVDATHGMPSADAGPASPVTRTYTTSAAMTTAAAITAAPTAGLKIVAMDIWVSNLSAVDMIFTVQMETTSNVLIRVPVRSMTCIPITLRGFIKGDLADRKLYGKASVAGTVDITAVYFSEV